MKHLPLVGVYLNAKYDERFFKNGVSILIETSNRKLISLDSSLFVKIEIRNNNNSSSKSSSDDERWKTKIQIGEKFVILSEEKFLVNGEVIISPGRKSFVKRGKIIGEFLAPRWFFRVNLVTKLDFFPVCGKDGKGFVIGDFCLLPERGMEEEREKEELKELLGAVDDSKMEELLSGGSAEMETNAIGDWERARFMRNDRKVKRKSGSFVSVDEYKWLCDILPIACKEIKRYGFVKPLEFMKNGKMAKTCERVDKSIGTMNKHVILVETPKKNELNDDLFYVLTLMKVDGIYDEELDKIVSFNQNIMKLLKYGHGEIEEFEENFISIKNGEAKKYRKEELIRLGLVLYDRYVLTLKHLLISCRLNQLSRTVTTYKDGERFFQVCKNFVETQRIFDYGRRFPTSQYLGTYGEFIEATLDDVIDDQNNSEIGIAMKIILIQTIYALYCALSEFGFLHNDMHGGNVMIKFIHQQPSYKSAENMYFHFNEDYKFRIPLSEVNYVVKIIDFERSYMKQNPTNHLNNGSNVNPLNYFFELINDMNYENGVIHRKGKTKFTEITDLKTLALWLTFPENRINCTEVNTFLMDIKNIPYKKIFSSGITEDYYHRILDMDFFKKSKYFVEESIDYNNLPTNELHYCYIYNKEGMIRENKMDEYLQDYPNDAICYYCHNLDNILEEDRGN